MHHFIRWHGQVSKAVCYLQSPMLLAVRLYWGWQFAQTGWGKLHKLAQISHFFAGLHIPFPTANAYFVSGLEFVGGILLILGLGTRFIGLLLAFDMLVAYWTADHEAFVAFLSDPGKFYVADPYTFLFASLMVLIFGAGVFSIDAAFKRRIEGISFSRTSMEPFMRSKQFLSAIVLAALLPLLHVSAEQVKGLQPGVNAPAFSLQDQQGKKQDLSSLTGPNGLLLLFFRSADWCPFCKGQLVDLEGMQKAFASKGIAVAAVSYDSPAILADFAKRRSITYPLLSDTSSSLIDAFGIRNTEATGMQAGIPYPGYYLIDPHGLIQKRFFEASFYNRLTASNLYSNLFGEFALPAPAKTLPSTPYVTVQTIQSDEEITPGAVFQLVVAITPGTDTHIYAPGAEKLNYHVASLVIDPSGLYSAAAVTYPKSEMMNFPELAQTVPVYTERTLLTTSVAATVNQQTLAQFAAKPNLPIKGTVNYQACTSKVCYPPTTVAVEWNIHLRPLDRQRAPEAMQHK